MKQLFMSMIVLGLASIVVFARPGTVSEITTSYGFLTPVDVEVKIQRMIEGKRAVLEFSLRGWPSEHMYAESLRRCIPIGYISALNSFCDDIAYHRYDLSYEVMKPEYPACWLVWKAAKEFNEDPEAYRNNFNTFKCEDYESENRAS